MRCGFGQITRSGIPDGVVNIVTGLAHGGRCTRRDPDVDKVAFTVRRKRASASSRPRSAISRSVMNRREVAVFVFPDANLDLASDGPANAIFFNSGQVCSAGSRLSFNRSVRRVVGA